MKVMISQPRYLPAMSYIERIKQADVFIILDNVQRNPRFFENRNKITDKNGNQKWLTIPIESSNRALIKDTIISGHEWKTDHYNKVKNYYNDFTVEYMFSRYLSSMNTDSYRDSLVSGLNYLKRLFEIKTKFVLASSLSNASNGGINELVNLVKKVNGDVYISGPSCLDYGFTPEFAKENGLELEIDKGTNYMPWIEVFK
jgi:hypothetical protein